MLKQLEISNFRCYTNSTIYFNGTSIIVGKNNAGKSTLIEALKIISSVSRKYKSLRFQAPPEWLPNESDFGVSPNVENMNISDRGIFNMYGDPPALIVATFTNGTSIKAYVGEELSIFAIIIDSDGYIVRSQSEAKYVDIPLIEVLPQISAVLDNEKVIRKNTVDGNRSTRLASRNFRNQLYYYSFAFEKFKQLVESTWETLQVKPVETYFSDGDRLLQFFVRVNNFEAEIGWMGHGLQMWVQTMWFISQCPNNAIVVLDEPDVYMHADLQRRLVRLIMPMFSQLIIATHSLEIIEEVPSDSIIPIDSSKRIIKPIGDEKYLQKLTDNLGSPLNIDLARLFVSQRFLIFNCDDFGRKILSAFQSILYPNDLHPIITFPKAFVGGGFEWAKVKTIADVFRENNMSLKIYCLLDSDYHLPNEIDYMSQSACQYGVNLHKWSMIEMDNYAINPDVILRYIESNKRDGKIDLELLERKMGDIAICLKKEFLYLLADKLVCNNGMSKDDAKEEAELLMSNRWNNQFEFISGRKFFQQLSLWTQEEYGINISAYQVASYFHTYEITLEIKDVLSKIMRGELLS